MNFYLPSERGAVRAVSNKANGCVELKRREVFRLQSIGGSSNLIPDSWAVAVVDAAVCWPSWPACAAAAPPALGGRGAMIGGSQSDWDKGSIAPARPAAPAAAAAAAAPETS